jgi:hypothetical protein
MVDDEQLKINTNCDKKRYNMTSAVFDAVGAFIIANSCPIKPSSQCKTSKK